MDVDPAEIVAFARRDWGRVARIGEAAWLELKRRTEPAAGVWLGAALRERARAEHPEWPSPAERAADRAAHARLRSKLRLASERLGL